MTASRSLLEIVAERMEAGTIPLPVLHPSSDALQTKLSGGGIELNQAKQLILQDPTFCVQVLKAANSDFYAGMTKIGTIPDAMKRLGPDRTSNLVAQIMASRDHGPHDQVLNELARALWTHSIVCARGAAWLMRRAGYPELAAELYMVGLLHDIGKLLVLQVLDDLRDSHDVDLCLEEGSVKDLVDTNHAEHGYRLLQQWNLPEQYCDLVREHHAFDFDPDDVELSALRLVDAAATKVGASGAADESVVLSALPEAAGLGVKDVVLAELEIMMEDSLARISPVAGPKPAADPPEQSEGEVLAMPRVRLTSQG